MFHLLDSVNQHFFKDKFLYYRFEADRLRGRPYFNLMQVRVSSNTMVLAHIM